MYVRTMSSRRRSGDKQSSTQLSRKAATSSGVLAELQQGLGNRGMQRLIGHTVQMKRSASMPIQRKGAPGSGNGMPEPVQEKMESAFGADFSDVRIHEGSQASNVGAIAYTQGDDIHFASGQYKPNTAGAQQLLGHELAHVVQQRSGRVKPTAEVSGIPLNDDAALEAEADRLGADAARNSAGAANK